MSALSDFINYISTYKIKVLWVGLNAMHIAQLNDDCSFCNKNFNLKLTDKYNLYTCIQTDVCNALIVVLM